MEVMLYNLYHFAVGIKPGQLPQSEAGTPAIQAIIQIIFVIIGALALLMIVVSGFRYITAAGDPNKVSQAKNGVVYALIGLLVALAAQAIVAFVGKRL